MRHWKTLTHKEQDERISAALANNIDFSNDITLGIPASKLDQTVFYEQASFLKDAPLLRAYVQNPNHIGCHTMGDSEPFFAGTQALEREVICLLSEDVFKAAPDSCDGYVASGGTEANLQAAWIYRNYFVNHCGATLDEVFIIASADTHYSVAKAANLLNLDLVQVSVDDDTRMIDPGVFDEAIKEVKRKGKQYAIIFCNMGTTMFGSVDDPDVYVAAMNKYQLQFCMHVDGAYGGFIYPISAQESKLHFGNEYISSITLDAHKMLQAPYGTGIFLVRKGLIQNVCTKEARYVSGMDMTLSGSRSGANAIAIWMILFTYGPFGWLEKINKLLFRTQWLCRQLDEKGISYYRHPAMNIVTIRARHIAPAIAEHYRLVPDDHEGHAAWYKIVVMDHVSIDQLERFAAAL